MIFQIRDDIFDYYEDSRIGKPTGNDMAEGKLTLPVIYALNHTQDAAMLALARKVKEGSVNKEEINRLVAFAKEQGGIDYAEKVMWRLHAQSEQFLQDKVSSLSIRQAFKAYLDFVIERAL